MPVKRLTDRQSIEARYPVLGKLRKGNKKKAAEMLGIPRSTLFDKLRKYDIG